MGARGNSGVILSQILRGLAGASIVGGDVVEVAPQYDGPGQHTALMAANVLYAFLGLLSLRRG